jgi:hypothetical protein
LIIFDTSVLWIPPFVKPGGEAIAEVTGILGPPRHKN